MKLLSIIVFTLVLFLIVFPRHVIYAADTGTQSATISPTPSTFLYTLPYPGILPDNPLYSLKVFRDRIISFFIVSHAKKSSFYLLQSDKRLGASWYLLKKDKKSESLAISTLSKSTNYLQQSLDEAKNVARSGEDMGDLLKRLQAAVGKHIEVVKSMEQLIGMSQSGSLGQEEKRLTDLKKMVDEFGKK